MSFLPGRIEKHLVNYVAKNNKHQFERKQNTIIKNVIEKTSNKPNLNFHLVSFSCRRDLSDQLLSIFSFYLNVGKPVKWTIISDGTYTAKNKELLSQIPNVTVVDWDALNGTIDERLYEYSKVVPLGKKLHGYSSISIEETTIMVDSDVLFYPHFSEFIDPLSEKRCNWFLLDHGPTYREEFYWKIYNRKSVNYLNSGFMVLNWKPDWKIALGYIRKTSEINGWCYLTEQTAIDIMFQSELNTQPLNSRHFILDNSDNFHLKHNFDYKKVAIRHFAGKQARNKMWQTEFVQALLSNNF